MFNQSPRSDDAGKGSVFHRGIATLGGALGIGSAILLTPLLFEKTRAPLFSYLAEVWGDDLANLLTWTFGVVEAVIIYASVKLVFTSLVVWSFAALAARRFPVG